jgi:hypothetical protein
MFDCGRGDPFRKASVYWLLSNDSETQKNRNTIGEFKISRNGVKARHLTREGPQ